MVWCRHPHMTGERVGGCFLRHRISSLCVRLPTRDLSPFVLKCVAALAQSSTSSETLSIRHYRESRRQTRDLQRGKDNIGRCHVIHTRRISRKRSAHRSTSPRPCVVTHLDTQNVIRCALWSIHGRRYGTSMLPTTTIQWQLVWGDAVLVMLHGWFKESTPRVEGIQGVELGDVVRWDERG